MLQGDGGLVCDSTDIPRCPCAAPSVPRAPGREPSPGCGSGLVGVSSHPGSRLPAEQVAETPFLPVPGAGHAPSSVRPPLGEGPCLLNISAPAALEAETLELNGTVNRAQSGSHKLCHPGHDTRETVKEMHLSPALVGKW